MKFIRILFLLIIAASLEASAGKLLLPKGATTFYADTDTIIRKRSISVGLNFGSDAMFFGRTGPIRYPFYSADVIYNTKQGFFAYGSVLRLIGYRTSIDEIDIGGGYLYRPSKKFSGSISYTRFIFNKEQRIIESATNNDINFKNAYDWGPFKSTVVMDYLFGRSNDFFITLSQSKYFEPDWRLFSNNDYLTFNPTVSMILGTQNFVHTYSLDHQEGILNPNVIKLDNSAYQYNNGRFNALNYSFKLPIAYNRPHYTFEFAYKYSIPVNVQGSLRNKRESFYNLTFFYLFY
ncbi:hypothetical protein [Mucilaginibacter auburnensis]|uniref:Uncharacterized protein n=1 Tax=Mucilaginibacter auburnensis TaxID=1457233 RepID=A0A2H9VPP3_9SPHI|nr:hypothetical protein [Mucilaginibacter auburnensis]PJJ80318.1 hypothetical protein CLV57_3468 [Mucilaginibacter auburnensis]